MFIRLLISALFIFTSMKLHAQTVNASNTPVAIPDNNPAGVDVLFNVPGSGIEVSSISLMIELEHTWMGDVSATLFSPNGEAQLVILSRVGSGIGSSFGDSSDLDGMYIFEDRGGDFWQAAVGTAPDQAIPPGIYTASTAGNPGQSNYGGRKTSMNGVFGDLLTGSTGVQGEGQWILNVSDNFNNDTGNVVSATLMINTTDLIFANDFDATVVVSATKNRLDMTGNGLADFGVLGQGVNNELIWRILENLDDGITGTVDTFELGNSIVDSRNTADFDGDGISDPAAYNNNDQNYLIKRSSRPGSPTLPIPIVTAGLNPLVVGDYDGDGIDDPAVFNQGQNTNDPNSLHYRSSINGSMITVPMGVFDGSTQRILGGHDYTGDGIADIMVASAGNYTIRDGKDGTVEDTFSFGASSDAVLMFGNYAGDNRADITRVFINGSDVVWQTRETGTGTESTEVILGEIGLIGFSEFTASGDYDGDGLLDYVIWRRDNNNPDSAEFIIRPSTNTATTINVIHGSIGEVPMADAQAG